MALVMALGLPGWSGLELFRCIHFCFSGEVFALLLLSTTLLNSYHWVCFLYSEREYVAVDLVVVTAVAFPSNYAELRRLSRLERFGSSNTMNRSVLIIFFIQVPVNLETPIQFTSIYASSGHQYATATRTWTTATLLIHGLYRHPLRRQ